MNQLEQTITTVEIADMANTSHRTIMRKLEGQEVKGKHIKGIIEVLTDANLGTSDFFIESTYKDASGKENKCYKVTKKGCEFLAHKFQGEKGILFTARYINKFHTMEQALQHPQPQLPDHDETERIFASWSSPRLLPPPRETWYDRNKMKIKGICGYYGWNRKFLYHKILTELGTMFDLNEAKRTYVRENGFAPYYATDIIEYFPQLQEQADRYINYLLED